MSSALSLFDISDQARGSEKPAPREAWCDVQMGSEEYHQRPEMGSSVVKRALIHPGRIDAPSGIHPKAAEYGNRIHTAVIEPEEIDRLYCVSPNPDEYPDALRTSADLRDALKSAGVKGYSGKKSAELVEMVRESVPGALLWADVLSRHGSESKGKTFVSAEDWSEMYRVADAVADHSVIRDQGIFSDGIGEASFFADVTCSKISGRSWAMKARPDWLQMGRRVSDLKTWAGGEGVESFYRAADRYHYDLSAALYLDVLREHGHDSDVFQWVIVDKSTAKTGGRVIVHVVKMSPRFIERGRAKLALALRRIHQWQSSPVDYLREEEVEHEAEPPRYGWSGGAKL